MKSRPDRLRLGLPKGSLQETTRKLLARAGFNVRISGRSYYPDIDDPEIECILIRPQEMARYIEQGVMDCGITGHDWIVESGAQVAELSDLRAPWPNYGVVRWVLAVKQDSAVRAVTDLAGASIATEVVGLTRRYLANAGVEARVEFSWGATEVKPPVLADAIVDVTETGSSLRANQLRVVDTVLESTPRLVANREALEGAWKRDKMVRLAMLLGGAIAAATRVYLAMNVPRDNLDAVVEVLPALATPTIANLSDPRWVDVTAVVEERAVRDLIPRLSAVGARGIIEMALNKIVD